MTIPEIDLSEYQYNLPESKIAKFPLAQRDASKLLLYSKGIINERKFADIVSELPSDTTLVFNNTKVIPARLHFQKKTGANIEIFLLQPVAPSPVISENLSSNRSVTWLCMIGNAKKWSLDTPLDREITVEGKKVSVTAKWLSTDPNQVQIYWNETSVRFVDVVEKAGQVPLPPYLKRKAEHQDKDRYQTVYSMKEGAVAAPTAGLHFTENVLNELNSKGISQQYLTLHVSAGTFQPIKVKDVTLHPMHCEQIEIEKSTIQAIANAGKTIAVGTTSMRTLESLYWYGVKLLGGMATHLFIEKLFPYQDHPNLPSRAASFQAILEYMEANQLSKLFGETEIFIFPGYQFRVCDGLITNFHQPESTLILLIAAFVGEDWKKIYQFALENNFRFLSYGDSSLLWKSN